MKQISEHMSRISKMRKNYVGGFKSPEVQKRIQEIQKANREAKKKADKAVEDLR